MFKNLVSTSQKTLHISTAQLWSTQYTKKFSVYSGHHSKLISTLCGQIAYFRVVEAGDTYTYRCDHGSLSRVANQIKIATIVKWDSKDQTYSSEFLRS